MNDEDEVRLSEYEEHFKIHREGRQLVAVERGRSPLEVGTLGYEDSPDKLIAWMDQRLAKRSANGH